MLRNDNNIIKNGDKIFESQVVDSYLRHNDDGCSRLCLTTTGLSVSDPLYIYYQTPSETIKCTYIYNGNSNVSFVPTNETSYKKYYFCGNVEGVTSFCPTLNTYPYNGYYTGDMIGLMNEFPNLQAMLLCQSNREVDFNQNITNASFPRNLTTFKICDAGIAGDLTTVENFENLEYVDLCYTQFSGTFSDIPFKNLKELKVDYTNTVCINVNDLLDNNPSLYCLSSYNSNAQTVNGTTLDISNLTYLREYWAGSASKSGSMSGWTFNTGMTYFQIYVTQPLGGDISNWDISDTKLTCFELSNYGYGGNVISGENVFANGYPDTLQRFQMYGTEQITSISGDFSNANDLNNIYFYRLCALSGDVTTWSFPTGLTSLSLYYTQLTGNLENVDLPNLTSVQFRYANFTGNISGITMGTGATSVYLNDNNLTGEITTYPNTPSGILDVSDNTGLTLNLSSTYTPPSSQLYISNIGAITGDWQNLDLSTATRLCMDRNSNISASNFDKIDLSNLTTISFSSTNLTGDYTGIFTGTTNLTQVSMTTNYGFSADTTNWNLGGIQVFQAYYTPIYGTLCNDNAYQLRVNGTCISSNIETDFSFSGRSYWIELSSTCITGHLSGVTFHPNTYQFIVNNNSNLYGSNEFSDYLFNNRKNWTRNYSSVSYQSIGDTPTGTYQQGDLGTWSGDQWDLTEAQINNLAVGTDYTGSGTNVAWTSKEKVWWNECARCPGGTVLRYCIMYITL